MKYCTLYQSNILYHIQYLIQILDIRAENSFEMTILEVGFSHWSANYWRYHFKNWKNVGGGFGNWVEIQSESLQLSEPNCALAEIRFAKLIQPAGSRAAQCSGYPTAISWGWGTCWRSTEIKSISRFSLWSIVWNGYKTKVLTMYYCTDFCDFSGLSKSLPCSSLSPGRAAWTRSWRRMGWPGSWWRARSPGWAKLEGCPGCPWNVKFSPRLRFIGVKGHL